MWRRTTIPTQNFLKSLSSPGSITYQQIDQVVKDLKLMNARIKWLDESSALLEGLDGDKVIARISITFFKKAMTVIVNTDIGTDLWFYEEVEE